MHKFSNKTREAHNRDDKSEHIYNNLKQTFNANSDTNAWLFFENHEPFPVHAEGKTGVFRGYISLISGIFSVEKLQQNSIKQQIFTTDNCDIEMGKLSDKNHIIFIGEHFLQHDKDRQTTIENATFITGIQAYELALKLTADVNSSAINNRKCVIFFPDNFTEELGEDNLRKINHYLSSMDDNLYNTNLLDNIPYYKPFLYEKNVDYKKAKFLSLGKKRKKVIVIDFGTTSFAKETLNNYFDCIFCHYTETARSILYLYKKKRISGVIIAPSLVNTDSLPKQVYNEVSKIITSKIPVLGLEFGAVLMAEILGSRTVINNNSYCYNEYFIMNYQHELFRVSNLYYKGIAETPKDLNPIFYDKNNYTAGFYDYKHNNIGYNFSFCFIASGTTTLLNNFYKLLD